MAFALCTAAGGASAEYPEKPIRLIVPFPAGGTVDLVARLVTARMADDLKTSFVIENRGGAGGVIATDATAKAAPDGYTLLLTAPNHTINAALQAKLPYDTEKDLAPVALVAQVPELLVSHPAAPFGDFAELHRLCEGEPGQAQLFLGRQRHAAARHHGVAAAPLRRGGHAYSLSRRRARDDRPLAGQVQLKMDTYATAAQHVAAGRLRALAYAGAKRSKLMPDLPTVAEMGLPGYEGVLWMGIVAPAATPKPVIERLAASVKRAVGDALLADRLTREGIDPLASTSEEFGALIAKEIGQWRELAKSVNIKLD